MTCSQRYSHNVPLCNIKLNTTFGNPGWSAQPRHKYPTDHVQYVCNYAVHYCDIRS